MNNLAGMVNFVMSIPASNKEVRDKFLYKIMATNSEMSFISEPEITKEIAVSLKQIVQEIDAFIFTQPNRIFKKSNTPHFLDKNFKLIIDANGNCEIDDIEININSKYHDEHIENCSDEQKERKLKSESFLTNKRIKVNTNLPSIEDEVSIKIRSLKEVVDRAYALLVIAIKGEGIEQIHLEKLVKEKNINSFSPAEEIVFKSTALNEQEKINAIWRYESLYVMLWALGKFNKLKYPNEICDVEQIVETMYKPTRAEFENSAKLRSKVEILNELDKIYRMHWACVDSRIKGQEVSGDIIPSVVYERHYSLNWLTNYENQKWDDIQTNT